MNGDGRILLTCLFEKLPLASKAEDYRKRLP
jgi:hypothetical protein